MALFKKKQQIAPEEIDLSAIDRESKYKIFPEKGERVIQIILTLWALFQLYASIFNKVPLSSFTPPPRMPTAASCPGTTSC